MTTSTRFERDLPMLLDDLYGTGTPDYRNDLVERIAATRQRPAWTFPERWLPMDVATQAVPTARMPWRQVGILALIALLLAIAVIGVVGSQRRLPEPFGIAANGRLAYITEGDVVARDTVDGPARVLVSGPELEVGAWFSPRGDRLLVIREVAGGEEAWIADPDGSNLIRLRDEPFQGASWTEFSPDGTLLAIQHDVAGIPRIDLVATDGSGPRRLTEMTAMTPTFRPPDGREILFRGLDPETGRWGFYLVDVEGGEPVRLKIQGNDLEGGGYDLLSPAWSPTGDRLSYHTLVPLPLSVGQTNGFRIRVASIDAGGTVTAVAPFEADATSDDEMNPLFTQDGQALLFQQRFGLLGVTDYTDAAWIRDLTPGSVARPLGAETTNGDGLLIAVTPDDGSIFVHLDRENEDWQAPRSGGPAVRTDIGSSSGVAWQRDAP